MSTNRLPQNVALALAALSSLAIGSTVGGVRSADDSSPSPPSEVVAKQVRGGGWDLNSNEPVLLDTPR